MLDPFLPLDSESIYPCLTPLKMIPNPPEKRNGESLKPEASKPLSVLGGKWGQFHDLVTPLVI